MSRMGNQPNSNGNRKQPAAGGPNGSGANSTPKDGGKLIVITAPLTETIDHAGFFIQMGMASMPIWLEGVLDRKYPNWRNVEYNDDGSALYMPAGARLVQKSLEREFSKEDIVACYPDDLEKFIGPRTRVVAVSTHNPLGVTFAAGVYTSIFGSSKEPINSKYSKLAFYKIKASPFRGNFKVIVGGSGGWQITNMNAYDDLSVDCVVEGRSESEETLELFRKAIRGEALPRQVDVSHPTSRDGILTPDTRTTFGVVEMTTGCGRRCHFCVPDLNPQIDVPKENIMLWLAARLMDDFVLEVLEVRNVQLAHSLDGGDQHGGVATPVRLGAQPLLRRAQCPEDPGAVEPLAFTVFTEAHEVFLRWPDD